MAGLGKKGLGFQGEWLLLQKPRFDILVTSAAECRDPYPLARR